MNDQMVIILIANNRKKEFLPISVKNISIFGFIHSDGDISEVAVLSCKSANICSGFNNKSGLFYIQFEGNKKYILHWFDFDDRLDEKVVFEKM